jgi:putative membrane protein
MRKLSHGKLYKTLRKTAGVVTAAAVLVSTAAAGGAVPTASAAATGSATKSETVYVNLDSTGNVEKETVTDWLHTDTAGAVIADRSSLSNIVNIKGKETPQISGSNVTWTLSGNDLYYQGETAKTPPVSMTIRYFLDGKSISASDLAGKSGKFEMKLSFQNKDAHTVVIDGETKTVYTPFACVAAFNLPKKNFTNVKTNFGSVVGDGSNQAVSYLGLPGLKESLSMLDLSDAGLPDELDVTADVQNFTLGPIMAVVSPVPDLDSLKNTDSVEELTDKLDQLIDAGLQLKNATGTLSAGETAFANGVSELYQGVSTAGASFNQIVAGAKTLNSAVGNSKTGVSALADGTGSLASGSSQLANGLNRLFAQFGTGTASSPTLKDSVNTLNSGTQQLADGISALFAQLSPAESGKSATLADGVNSLNTGVSQYTALTNSALFGMVETNLQTLRSALSSSLNQALAGQGLTQAQIDATAQNAFTAAVSNELTGLHGAADAALIQSLTASKSAEKEAYYNSACVFVNLYDILSVVTSDPAVAGLTDQTKKEAAFEREMASSSSYFYKFSKSSLPTTLAAVSSLTDAQRSGLTAAAGAVPDAKFSAAASEINGQNVVLAGKSVSAGAAALAAQLKESVSGQSATLYDSVNLLNRKMRELAGGTDKLAAQMVTGGTSSTTLYDSVAALNSGAEKLSSGAGALASGASGLSSLKSGVSSLTNALEQFGGGISQLQSGASVLNGKSRLLVSGTADLNSGMSQFWTKGLSKLQSVDTGKYRQALAVKDELIQLANQYTDFTGKGDHITSSVKFVMKTNEIKVSDKTAAQTSASSSADQPNFWQRIGNWFRSLFQ